jgi:O-antigen/teichoic acid export membrane protein
MSTGSHGVATHYRRYATGNLLVILASLVSFPIFTRLLDNTQYGMFGYYGTWVVMGVAISKLGAQHAILRFYPHDGNAEQLHAFSTNLFYAPLGLSMLLWGAVVLGLLLLDGITGLRQSSLFWMVVVSTPLVVFLSQVDTVLRITERSRAVMLSRAAWRWGELALMLAAVMLFQRTAVAAYGGKLAAALLVAIFFGFWIRRHFTFSRSALDRASVREGLAYGMPLALNEVIAVALISLDRIMLLGLSGDFAAVGIYTIGVSLATQLSIFMNATVFEAFIPVANRLYMTEGPQAVRMLKQRMLLPMTYAAVGAAMLLWLFGTDLIIAASGTAKAASGPVFALTGVVCALQPLLLLSGYGLLLQQRSSRVLWLMCAALAVNVALNLLWIPAFGVMGSVYATAVSSFALAFGHCAWVPRELLQLPDPRTVLIAGGAGLACVGLAWGSGLFGLHPGWPRLLAGGSAAAIGYALLVLALDPRARSLVRNWRSERPLEATSAGWN